jgi:DNA-binding winged helix-turn-helix (wHTH) protein
MARFGAFELDGLRRQLRRAGQAIHLTPKAFDLLKLLVDAAPRVVPKTEIHETLWPRTFVSDATLIGLIKELRRALDDHDRTVPVIRTAHRIGYAFCPAVDDVHSRASEARGWLVLRERRIPIVSGTNLIGRDPACDVWLDYATVSRRHARIFAAEARVEIEDLGSKNGTQIGGTVLKEPIALRDGDELRFGQILLTFRASTVALPTAAHTLSRNLARVESDQ